MIRGGRGLGVAAACFVLACAGSPAEVGSPVAASSATAAPAQAAAGAFAPPPAASFAPAPTHILLVSVAGLSPRAYGVTGQPAWMPSLAAIARDGAAAEAVVPVVPASPGPAHATFATGRTPAIHGIASDHPLGARGTDAARHRNVATLEVPALWALARQAGASAALIGWPTTVGAKVDWLFPELIPARIGEASPAILEGQVSVGLWPEALLLGADRPEAGFPGPVRDELIAGLACHVFASAAPPRLTLLRFSQTEVALRRAGPHTPAVAEAFAGVDAALGRVLGCLASAGRLRATAVLVVGDAPVTSVHTLVQPNVALAAAGLMTPRRSGRPGIQRWEAVARSNGTSAFVYARDSEAAVLARQALGELAGQTLAFRIVSAEEMLTLGTDREAWFGLEAHPGFVFGDSLRGDRSILPSAARGAWGALEVEADDELGFVAWGAGVRTGIRIPELRQTDVAPTVARLLGLELGAAEGRALVGALRSAPPSVAAPRGMPGAP